MRTVFGLAAMVLSCGVAAAQAPVWKDPTGRLSFDLAGTGWELIPRDSSSNGVILNLGPEGAAKAAAAKITRLCMLDHLHQSTDASRTQANANDALRLSAEDEKAKMASRGQPYTEQIITRDGVAMREILEVQPSPATGNPLQTIRWNFVLSTPGAYHFMGLMCIVDESAAPNGRAELRSIMGRMRIAAEAG